MNSLTVAGAPGVLGAAGEVEASAVELFERWWETWEERGSVATGRPASYRSLLPAEAPGPGRQYRFEVDLDRCTGCKACVTACHSLNGLDEGETWRAVGVLSGGSPLGTSAVTSTGSTTVLPAATPVWTQHITTACHHCVEPACMAGCPVDAYEKDPVTGIVAHLDDQCIGCRYCMLMCPYEVPSYNARLGIVRKCDMCTHRLAEGEPPACVQGCPTQAIAVGLVDVDEVSATAAPAAARLVPTAPRSHLTTPTTLYRTERAIPTDAVAGDDHRLSPAHNHPPLVAMLVLTQLSVGAVTATQLANWSGAWSGGPGAGPALVVFVTALVAMGAAVLHLGRPLVAWRAVLGIGHSWLSREIVAFSVYAGVAGAGAASAIGVLPEAWEPWLGVATVASGAFAVWCSVRLYAVTGHPLWRVDRVVARFAPTALVTGAAAVAAVEATAAAADPGAAVDAHAVTTAAAVAVTVGVMAMVLATVAFLWRHRGQRDAMGRSAHLMANQLRRRVELSIGLAAVTVVAAIAAAVAGNARPTAAAVLWVTALVAAVASAWVERELFFTADAPDRMPGGSR